MKIQIKIIKYIYLIYHYLFFQAYNKYKYRYKWVAETYLAIKLLKYSTKYSIYRNLESFYFLYKEYDGLNPKGMLLCPRRIKKMSEASYLYNHIWIGYHPTLKSNPISLNEILELNLHKDDKPYTIFLEKYLKYYWEGPHRCITRWALNDMMGIK
jgi:hypothetical protein